ncbi:T9SS type A sorting domain-containing protein [Gilvibacter sp.]|uniref:T9SS type A sorting domain-containing protein n=1 Tax=Gilvibacter sp. TaxID=2729997 RepID=UPI003B523578
MRKSILMAALLLGATPNLISQTIQMELAAPQPFLQGTDTGDMEFADLDGDGDMDLIATGSGNMSDGSTHGALTTLYFNDGAGNFTAVNDHGIENIRVSKIALANIDTDEDLDLLISGFTSGGFALTKLYTNDGSGNFTEVTGSPFECLENGYFNFGDIDGDNDQDIVFSGGHSGIEDVVKYINDGNGNFSLDTTMGVTGISGVLDLSDYDNDNDLDLIVCGIDSFGNISTQVYNNDGNGDFELVADAGLNGVEFGDIAAADTDGDEDLDLVICGSSAAGDFVTEFYRNNGDNTFTQLIDVPFLGLAADGETSFNDFDNDGDVDVFVIGSANGGLPNIFSHIYENLGDNNFVLSDEFVGGYLSTHAVADVDGDSLLDVVIGGTTTGTPVRGSFLYKNVSAVLNTNETALNASVSIYPNPSPGQFNVSLTAIPNAQLALYNIAGQLIFKKTLILDTNKLDLNLSNGVYLVVIKNDNQQLTRKLVIRN